MHKFWISKLIPAVLVFAFASPGHTSPLLQPLCKFALQLDILGRYNNRGAININEVPAQTLERVPEFNAVTRHWLFQKVIDHGDARSLYPNFFVVNGTDPVHHFKVIYEALQRYYRNGPEIRACDLSGRDARGAIVVRFATNRNPSIKIKSPKLKEEFLALRQSDPILYISLYAALGKTQDAVILNEATLNIRMPHRQTYILPVILNIGQGGDSLLLRNRWQPRYAHSLTSLLGQILLQMLTPEEFIELVFLHHYYRDADHYAEFKQLVNHVFEGDLDALDNPETFFAGLVQVAASFSEYEAKTVFERLEFPKIQKFMNGVLFGLDPDVDDTRLSDHPPGPTVIFFP